MPDLFETLNLSKSALIEASAGTGKTYTLERLILRLLTQELAPLALEDILIVTFTQKAADEMKQRIRLLISKAYEASQSPHLRDALLNFSDAPIETIHGFCQRVLLEHALQTGWRKSFEIEEGRDEVETAVRDVFRTLRADDPSIEKKITWFSIACGEESMEKIVACFVDLCLRDAFNPKKFFLLPDLQEARTCFEALEGQLTSNAFYHWSSELKELADTIESKTVTEDYESCLKRSSQRYKAIASAPLKMKQFSQTFMGREIDKNAVVSLAADDNHFLDVLSLSVWEKVLLKNKQKTDLKGLAFYRQAQKLGAYLRETIRPLIKPAGFYFAHTLAPLLDKKLKALKEESQKVCFDDLLSECAKALRQSPAFKKKLRHRFKRIFIDEFQDTDPIQWEIFETLCYDENKQVIPLFLIGDPKQAIYRFRGADLNVYFRAKERIDNTQALQVNYRSNEGYLENINTLFSQAFKGSMLSYLQMSASQKFQQTMIYRGGRAESAFSFWDLTPAKDKSHPFWEGGYLPAWKKDHGKADLRVFKRAV